MMIRNLIRSGVCVLALLAPLQASASFYLGADVGVSRWDVDTGDVNIDGSLGGRLDRADMVVGLRAGYQFTRNFGLEAAYRDLGESSFKGQSVGGWFYCPGSVSVSVEADVLELTAVGLAHVTDQLALTGRVGAAYWDSKVSLKDSCGSFSAEDSGTDLTFGLGVQWSPVDARWAVRLEGQQYQNVTEDDFTIRTVSLGGLIRF